MTAIIFDTETTGTDEPEIIEAAWVYVAFGPPLSPGPSACDRFRPSKPITLGAMATHHIMEEDLTECAASSEFSLPKVDFLIGHNVDFDWRAAGSPEVKRICTLALCRKLWPEADSHSQSAMLYLLDRKSARETLKAAHSASADVLICYDILRAILNKLKPASWDALWQQSELARIPDVMPFGKHKGVKVSEIPSDYKAWLLRQPDVDPYLRKALEA